MKKWITDPTTIALLLLLVVVSYGALVAHDLRKTVHAFIEHRSHPMQTLTQEVTRLNGDVVTVVTHREEGESVADFIARHDAVVLELKDS